MTPSPNPRPDRKQLSADELIAVFVALTSIGAIFFWSISQKNGSMDLPFIQSLASSSPPAASPLPSQSAAPAPAEPNSMTSPAPTTPPTASPIAAAPTEPAPPSPALRVVPLVTALPSPSPSVVPSPTVAAVPSVVPAKAFSDVPAGFWASAPIAALSARGIVNGFPDGRFLPNKPITRAEFAEMVQRAFDRPANREALKFNDVTSQYWAMAAIDKATQTGFMSGFPNGSFQPNRQIPRLQILLALAAGLKLQATASPSQTLSRYQDAAQVPQYAVNKVAAATEAGLVINNGDSQVLKPNQIATRAEAAALIYEALGKGK